MMGVGQIGDLKLKGIKKMGVKRIGDQAENHGCWTNSRFDRRKKDGC